MESKRSKNSLVVWVVLASLVSQNVVMPVMCRSLEGVGEQKNYYTPDPHTPSGGSHQHSPATPSHGSSGTYRGTPSHGSGGSYGTPSHGSSGSYGTPAHGSEGSGTPSQGGGGYYHSPPTHSTPSIITPPSSPTINPVTPTIPIVDPGTPTTPRISTPSTPLIPDPNTPPFFIGTCNYWSTHPELIWGLFGFWGTVAGVFGAACTSAYGQNLSLQQALANPRTDGIGALYREGTASFLNSMVNKKFPFTTKEVRDSFSAAIVSNKAAAAQAELFMHANEGRLKPRA